MNNDLKEILEQIRLHSQTGNRNELAHALRALMAKRREYYLQCVEEGGIEEFADALYKTLLLELDEEEEESIETAELAYIALCRLINSDAATPEHYKRRLLLLH